MSRAALLLTVLAACGSPAPVAKPVVQPEPVVAEPIASVESDADHRARITAEHHKLEDEQATALAAACDAPTPHAKKRCAPSCYDGEPADARAGKPVKAPIEVVHTVCTKAAAPDGPFAIVDELGADLRPIKGKPPAAAKKGSWQAHVETDMAAALKPLLARRDVVRVLGTWKPATNPVTREALRCVSVAHFAHGLHKALDACGGSGAAGQLACEASSNAAAHGINVVHFRLAEAARLHGVHDEVGCQEAAVEAIAVARGLPRWRQYTKLNTKLWQPFARYRTRFDGLLDEDDLFTTAAALGTEAEQLYATCAGAPPPHTSAADEQSFHTCW